VPAKSVSGGYPKAVVQTMVSGSGGPPKRQIASFSYVDLRWELGLGMGDPILNWVTAALSGNALAKSGTVIELDQQNRAKAYLDFTNARIVEFAVPGSDAATHTEGSFTVTASIGGAKERPGDNVVISVPSTPTNTLLTNNFRLSITGLPTTRVRSIAPLPFRLTTGPMLPADLVVTLSETDVGPWKAWAKDFIVDGHNGQDKEKHGAIEWLKPNLNTVVAKLAINQIGIQELAPIADATPRSYRASMYFEFGQFSLP
jgi:hypothetical protein